MSGDETGEQIPNPSLGGIVSRRETVSVSATRLPV